MGRPQNNNFSNGTYTSFLNASRVSLNETEKRKNNSFNSTSKRFDNDHNFKEYFNREPGPGSYGTPSTALSSQISGTSNTTANTA